MLAERRAVRHFRAGGGLGLAALPPRHRDAVDVLRQLHVGKVTAALKADESSFSSTKT
jgi:hypothetical protein